MSVLTFGLFWFLQFTRTLHSNFGCEKMKRWRMTSSYSNQKLSHLFRMRFDFRRNSKYLSSSTRDGAFDKHFAWNFIQKLNKINVSKKKKDLWIFLTSFAFFGSRKYQIASMWTGAIDVDQFVEFCQMWIVRQFRRIKKRQIKMCVTPTLVNCQRETIAIQHTTLHYKYVDDDDDDDVRKKE